MNFRLIALASCVALGSIALGGRAQAQNAVVPFSGAVLSACTFSAISAGVLARSGPLSAVEASSGVTNLGSSVGTAGSVRINCTGSTSTVTVALPVATTVPTIAPAYVAASLQSVVQLNGATTTTGYTSASSGTSFGGTWATYGGSAPLAVPVGLRTLNVGMIAGGPATDTLPAGTYTYNVTLTATAN